ncbi:MAG: hypothetical protein PHS46_08315 [Candidatus Omnitrophica bacterium]|nr:hypothetical protein [Candidatus Omnitrophota bacterium]
MMKFRVLDLRDETLYFPDDDMRGFIKRETGRENTGGTFAIDSQGNILLYYRDKDECEIWTPIDDDIEYSNFLVMLDTEFKDANGRVIYGKDRVRVSYYEHRGSKVSPGVAMGTVEFSDGCWCVAFDTPVWDDRLKTNRTHDYLKCYTVNHAVTSLGLDLRILKGWKYKTAKEKDGVK